MLRLLAENPEVRIMYPEHELYHAVEAAELDEPGADESPDRAETLGHPQFQDRPGACKLIEAAVSRGDQTMAQRLADCRAN